MRNYKSITWDPYHRFAIPTGNPESRAETVSYRVGLIGQHTLSLRGPCREGVLFHTFRNFMPLTQVLKEGHQGLARVVCLFGGAIWGLYWIPLRELDAAGIVGV